MSGTRVRARTPEDWKVGDFVLYVPGHADGDRQHPDCERGIITKMSRDPKSVFVQYMSGSIKSTSKCDLMRP